MLKLVKSKGVTALPALSVLEAVLRESPEQASQMVQEKVLGIICPVLMGKGLRQRHLELEQGHWEAVTGILAALLLFSQGDYRKRVVDKIL
jgi:hypothetical protein